MKKDNTTKKFIKTTIRDFLNERVNLYKNDIIKFVDDNSYFDYEGDVEGVLHFSTRKNGSVSNETVSDIDVEEGMKLKKQILKTFQNIKVVLEIVDEWVLLFISDINENVEEFRYTFIKDLKGSGFSESFKTMDELIQKYGDWVEVDWESIKNKVDNITNYPNNKYTGWFASDRIRIKLAGEEGNNWGYNFYIQKSKKIEG
jgi:hypothetical protein